MDPCSRNAGGRLSDAQLITLMGLDEISECLSSTQFNLTRAFTSNVTLTSNYAPKFIRSGVAHPQIESYSVNFSSYTSFYGNFNVGPINSYAFRNALDCPQTGSYPANFDRHPNPHGCSNHPSRPLIRSEPFQFTRPQSNFANGPVRQNMTSFVNGIPRSKPEEQPGRSQDFSHHLVPWKSVQQVIIPTHTRGPLIARTAGIDDSRIPRALRDNTIIYRSVEDPVDFILFSEHQLSASLHNMLTVIGLLFLPPRRLCAPPKVKPDGTPWIGPAGNVLYQISFLPDTITYEQVIHELADWQICLASALGWGQRHISDRVVCPEEYREKGEAEVKLFYSRLPRLLTNRASRFREVQSGLGPISRVGESQSLKRIPDTAKKTVGRGLIGLNYLHNVAWKVFFDKIDNKWYMRYDGQHHNIRSALPPPSKPARRVLRTLESIGIAPEKVPGLGDLVYLQEQFKRRSGPDGHPSDDDEEVWRVRWMQPKRRGRRRPGLAKPRRAPTRFLDDGRRVTCGEDGVFRYLDEPAGVMEGASGEVGAKV